MYLKGREINFLRTVDVTCKVADMCVDGDLSNAEQLFSGKQSDNLHNQAKFISYLNEGYELNKAFNVEDYEPKVINPEELVTLDQSTFDTLFSEAVEAFLEGVKATVEVEEEKKKEAVKE